MVISFRSRLAVAFIVLVAICSPGYSQKVLSEGIRDLATQIASSATKEKKQKIAVLPFRDLDGKSTILGSYISEELVTDLISAGGFDVVERAMLDRLLGEIKLEQTGVVDPETAKRIGKVASVDAIVTGSITELQSYVALNCRLIETQTGHVFSAAEARIVKDDDVRKIMGVALPGSPMGSSPASPPKADLQQQRVGSLLFELKKCSLLGRLVNCDFLVTNSGEDADVELWPRNARLIDGEGNEFHSEEAVLGSSQCGSYCRAAQAKLATGIPIRARLTFDGIPPETQRATLLEIRGSARSDYTIQFRNVSLVRP